VPDTARVTTDADRPPLLLLDVDGVLNALADDADSLAAWPRWERGWASADGRRWPIRWAPDVVDRLRDWHEDGRLELQWLTTWGHDANEELRRLIGLPELAVAGTYADEDLEGAPEVGAGQAHAAVAPAAPDPLSGRWWKYDVARRLREAHPDRRLIWVDDELHHPRSPFVRWAGDHGVLAVGPDPVTGLAPQDLRTIEQALP
jgi:hypothetical protein